MRTLCREGFFSKKAKGQHPADNTGAHGIDSGRTKSRRHCDDAPSQSRILFKPHRFDLVEGFDSVVEGG